MNKILISDDQVQVGAIMEKEDIKYISPDSPWRDVAKTMSKYNLINIPVTEKETNKLLGIISVDDVLPWLLDEK